MDASANLGLPYIMPLQAQKHVTHNEALRALDTLVQLAVADRDLPAPPASPSEGERYIVGPGASGAWTGKSGQIATFVDGAWAFQAPQPGWVAYLRDEAGLVNWDGADWVTTFGLDGEVPTLGINAAADLTNRLSVASAAVLLNHEGAGHQLKINKAAAGDTGSLLFQTGFSGRAELGTAGDDDFRLKVSADGAAWKSAIVVNRSTGHIGLGTAAATRPLTIDTRGYAVPASEAVVRIIGVTGSERVEFQSYGTTPNGAFLGFGAHGTPEAPTATLDGKRLFAILGSGHDGNTLVLPSPVQIDMVAQGNWSAGSHGTAIVFRTTPAGSTVAARAERMRIADTGMIGIGTATPARLLGVAADDSASAAVTPLVRLTHTTSGAPAAGIGVGIEFEVETASAENKEIGMKVDAVATSVGAGAENFDCVVSLMAGGGAAGEAFRIKSSGQLKLAAGAVAANGTVATVLGSLGPAGAHTTVQKWLALDIAGTTGWVPVF